MQGVCFGAPHGYFPPFSPDVDECRRSPHPCANGHCENSVGSYSCRCRAGFRADPSGAECQGVCAVGPQGFPPGVCPFLTDLPASLLPADIDECAKRPPPCTGGHCHNTHGSYRCSCPAGYRPSSTGSECQGNGGQAGGGGCRSSAAPGCTLRQWLMMTLIPYVQRAIAVQRILVDSKIVNSSIFS